MSLSSSPINPSLPNSDSKATLSSIRPSDEHLVILNLPISSKLTRGNFLAWKCQIIPALHGHGLYKYFDEEPPSKTITVGGVQSSNLAFYHWYKQDQLLLSWIRSSLSETILNQTVSCTTSAEIWKLLQYSFSASSRARLTELRRSLQNTTKGGSSYSDFCQRMRAIADELAFIGSPVSDDDLVIQILNGLGSDFNSVVAAANAKENLSFADLQAMLLSHESLLSQLGGNLSPLPSLQNPAALFTQPKSGLRGGYRPGKQYRPRGGYNSNRPPLLPQSRPNYPTRPNSNSLNRPPSNRAEQGYISDKNTMSNL